MSAVEFRRCPHRRNGTAFIFAVIVILVAIQLLHPKLIPVLEDSKLSHYVEQFVATVMEPLSSERIAPEKDVSIIITSSLIPNHPSINIIQQTIDSLSHLQMIPFDVPIFVTIDKPPKFKSDDDKNRLEEYIRRMQVATFEPFTNVKILVAPRHLHIAGSVHWAMTEFVKTQFVYVLQHDLAFAVDIDHDHLLQILNDSQHSRPWLRNIRFKLNGTAMNRRNLYCMPIHNGSNVKLEHGLKVYPTAKWSDNNQLSTRDYYLEMFELMIRISRKHSLEQPMEFPMSNAAWDNCSYWGQAVYGGRFDMISYLVHLDGRHSQSFHETNNSTKNRKQPNEIVLPRSNTVIE
eukprot:Nitzschia sp. Nitz4//scaffold265_size26576//6062//7102//NITZ4_008245-RA/size26576-processed-gene-0.32-mRNA-1//-1//CDS//3329544831//3889//frame0